MDVNLYRTEVQNWIIEINESRGKNPAKTIMYCDRLEEYGQKIKDDALIGFACFTRGETYYLMNNMQLFYAEMLACLPPMERIKEWGYVAMANNMLGIMSLNRGNAPYAMDYYIKSISYCQNYQLPDLEWIVHMNVGALYLNIEEYQKALDHIQNGYHYIIMHQELADYIENLTVAYVAMAKAYLKRDNMMQAMAYNDKLERECMPHLSDMNKLIVLCYQARLYNERTQNEKRDICIREIGSIVNDEVPIMDVFDDFYEYLQMLLTIQKYDEFFNIFDVMERLTKKTTIKNLEKKLLSLKIRYYRDNHMKKEYMESSVLFFELSECMERESRMMVSNMIVMRNNLNDLAQLNKEVEKENMALQRKSETDALTGLYNRFKLNEYGEQAFLRAYEHGTSLAIEILDIDYFKEFNDNYGHQAGDDCIREIANTILSLRKYGNIFCARYGGDEFVIIYEGFTEEETLSLATELKQQIIHKAIEHKFSKATDIVTISQGICWDIPRSNNKLWDYLHAADIMLYKVKAVSRNSIRLGHCNDSQ